VISEALRVMLIGVLGVFLVMALIYVVIVTLSRIRVPSNAGASETNLATEPNLMNGPVAVSETTSDFHHASAAEPIGPDSLAVENMDAADEWYEYHEYNGEMNEYDYEFSEYGDYFDSDDAYEYVVEEYYPDSELIDADQDTEAEEFRSLQIEEVRP